MTSLALSVESWIWLVSAVAGVALGAAAWLKNARSWKNASFAAGMGLLAAQQIVLAFGRAAVLGEDVLVAQRWRVALASVLPGVWLSFSAAILKSREHRRALRIVLFAAVCFPAALGIGFNGSVFTGIVLPGPSSGWLIPLGFPGVLLFGSILIVSALVLFALEYGLRAATGRIRWQVKFVTLGTAMICVPGIYAATQALLYHAVDTSRDIIVLASLPLACGIFFWAMVRSRFLDVELYLSRGAIHGSITLVLAGAYLVIVGAMAAFLKSNYGESSLPLQALFVLGALTVLGLLLLSERLQERLRRFISRHLRRPLFDYRTLWLELTESTRSVASAEELATEIARLVSRRLRTLSVNVWFHDPGRQRLFLAGSTVFGHSQAPGLEREGARVDELAERLKKCAGLLDLAESPCEWAQDIMCSQPDYFQEYKLRYAIPVFSAEGSLLGVITLNDDKVGGGDLSHEERELVTTYAVELAAGIVRIRLAEKLRQARQFEAFQHVSAFFVHDLKNLASRISLLLENLEVNHDNPEFRAAATRLLSGSLAEIERKIATLASLKQDFVLHREQTDLGALLSDTLEELKGTMRAELEVDVRSVPPANVDPALIKKVLTNLLLNAQEALAGEGRIRIAASADNGEIRLMVQDNGCGMSRQFLEECLFQPFCTSKKRGMGIGLFQARKIIEAHGGRIHVESAEGKGSTFLVIIPAGDTKAAA